MATEESELRKGPWTLEEDRLLIQYIASHGEGRWNLLARSSGLRRTGKSCRLRWLNYLKPDVKRGNLTPEEQIFILELHSKWGNRWSKIAQHLPGRTDNEIKNYWRTRVQKQARQLQVDANSAKFLDAVRCFWTPSLLQQIDSSTTVNDTKDSTPTIASDQAQHASYPPSCNMPNELNMHSNSFLSGISTSEDNCSSSISSMDISDFPTSPSPNFDNLLSEMRGCQLDSTYDMEAFKGLDYSVSDCSMSETYWSLADHMGDNLWDMDELRPMIQLQGRGPL